MLLPSFLRFNGVSFADYFRIYPMGFHSIGKKKQTNSHDEIKKVVGVQAVGAIFYLIIFF